MAVLLDCGGLSVSEVAASEYGLITMTIAFALSGGSSLGSVQVGMMQALADQGISPDLVVGTSAGAINAVWVAGGRPLDELAELEELERMGLEGTSTLLFSVCFDLRVGLFVLARCCRF